MNFIAIKSTTLKRKWVKFHCKDTRQETNIFNMRFGHLHSLDKKSQICSLHDNITLYLLSKGSILHSHANLNFIAIKSTTLKRKWVKFHCKDTRQETNIFNMRFGHLHSLDEKSQICSLHDNITLYLLSKRSILHSQASTVQKQNKVIQLLYIVKYKKP